MRCESERYHFDGYCFNKARLPEGMLAMPDVLCLSIDNEEEFEIHIEEIERAEGLAEEGGLLLA